MLFGALAALYAVLVDQWVIPERPTPVPYTQYLLQSTVGVAGRVVIESGSNSKYGIDVPTLVRHWQRPVVIVANQASYPLKHKLFNLKNHLEPGDTLILPLEWHYYVEGRDLAEVYTTRVADENLSLEFYFNALPILDKLEFVFTQFPFSSALSVLLEPRSYAELDDADVRRIDRFLRQLKNFDNASFGGNLKETSDSIDVVAAAMKCDQYVHTLAIPAGKAVLSDVFLSNLELLRVLADDGVSVYFMWPAVADREESACYALAQSRVHIEAFAADVVEAVTASGFRFVGDIEESHFGSQCFLDTYYHLTHSCAVKRTQAMLRAFEREGISLPRSAASQETLVERSTEFGMALKRRYAAERL
ncbi:MAG: hypothetical protein R3E54_14400 [Halioglobus sp.]